MIKPVAPVRQRHVVVDADEIDVGVRPERVEVEIHVARAIAGVVAEIFRPVGGVADLHAGAEDRADGSGQRLQRGNRRIGRCGIVAEVVFETSFPLSPIALGDAFDLSLAEDVEAVHECDADVDFGGLAVGVS